MKSICKYIYYAEVIYKEGGKDEWVGKATETVQEATDLISVGFEYTGVEYDGFRLFRKRK